MGHALLAKPQLGHAVGVGVGVSVGVGVAVGVREGVPVAVGVAVGVREDVAVGVGVVLGMGVGPDSTYEPFPTLPKTSVASHLITFVSLVALGVNINPTLAVPPAIT
jgi:hypothetical protein